MGTYVRLGALVAAACMLGVDVGVAAKTAGNGIASAEDAAPAAQVELSRTLWGAVERQDTSSVVALVVNHNGTLYQAAAGHSDTAHPEPLPLDAIFLLASMTKPITSVAAMILVQEGRIRLDDPVSQYLPGFEHLRVVTRWNALTGTYETRPSTRVMTIRHLLTHTSGIGYGFSNSIVKKLTETSHKNEWEVPLVSDPGERWTYGASTAVLGMIVEKVSGQSLEDFFQERIFRPLGMKDTSYAVPLAKQSRVVAVTRRVGGQLQEISRKHPIPSVPTPPFFGDGGLYSTAQDYGRFIQMMLGAGRLGEASLLNARSVSLMTRNNIGHQFVQEQPAADPALTRPFPIGAGRDKFGLGFQIAGPTHHDGYRSPGSLSWAGIYNTEFWIDPAKGIGGVMLMQLLPFYDERAIRLFRDFERSVYRNRP